FRLYADGVEKGKGVLTLGSVGNVLQLAPPKLPSADARHFGGKLASVTLVRRALSADEVKQMAAHAPEFSLFEFEEGSKPWAVQTRGQAGYRAPQDPSTLPMGKGPFTKPVAKKPESGPAVVANGNEQWTLANGWALAAAPTVSADGAAISKPG